MAVVASVLIGLVWLCRLYRGDRDRTRLLVAVAVGLGLLLVGGSDGAGWAYRLGARLVAAAQIVGWALGPAVLLAGLLVGGWWVARRAWRDWPAQRPAGRAVALVGSVGVGVLAATLLRAVPLVSAVTRVAEQAVSSGARAAVDAAVATAGRALGS